jgi:hypothetical protein
LKKSLIRHTAHDAADLVEEITAPGVRILLFRTSDVYRESFAGIPRWILGLQRAHANREPRWTSLEGFKSKTRALHAMILLAQMELQRAIGSVPAEQPSDGRS